MNQKQLIQTILIILTLAFALLPLFSTSQQKAALVTEYRYESELGEHIGGGVNGSYTPANADFSISGTLTSFTVTIKTKEGYWQIKFTAPKGEKLHAGHYAEIEPRSYYVHELPALNVSSNGAECNEYAGDFDITQLVSDATGNVTTLDAHFTQRCESTTAPPLRGAIKYNAKPIINK